MNYIVSHPWTNKLWCVSTLQEQKSWIRILCRFLALKSNRLKVCSGLRVFTLSRDFALRNRACCCEENSPKTFGWVFLVSFYVYDWSLILIFQLDWVFLAGNEFEKNVTVPEADFWRTKYLASLLAKRSEAHYRADEKSGIPGDKLS